MENKRLKEWIQSADLNHKEKKKCQESMEVIPCWRKYYFVLCSAGSNKKPSSTGQLPANTAYLSNLPAETNGSQASQQHHSFTLESGHLWNKIKIVRIISFASQAYVSIWFPYHSTDNRHRINIILRPAFTKIKITKPLTIRNIFWSIRVPAHYSLDHSE